MIGSLEVGLVVHLLNAEGKEARRAAVDRGGNRWEAKTPENQVNGDVMQHEFDDRNERVRHRLEVTESLARFQQPD